MQIIVCPTGPGFELNMLIPSYRTSTLLQLIYVSWSSTVNEIEEKPDTSLFQTRSGTDLFEPTHQLIKFYCLLSTHP